MDCIPYINDLRTEINILYDIKSHGNSSSLIDSQIKEKEYLIEKCKKNLEKLAVNSIEYRIYLKILEGKNPSLIIDEIANENYLNDKKPSSPSKIWKYYKNVKKIL